jgi:hypothetical protein
MGGVVCMVGWLDEKPPPTGCFHTHRTAFTGIAASNNVFETVASSVANGQA